MSKLFIAVLAAAGALVAGAALAQPGALPTELPTTSAGAVARLAKDLEDNYTNPEIGKLYATTLRDHQARGDYNEASDAAALAKKLTADLQVVHLDKHVRVSVEGADSIDPSHAGGPAPPPLKGVEETKWIKPGVAYIRFSLFSGEPEELKAVKAFMDEHATARAIIIDARGHHGGGLAEMNVMLPYLYAEKTVLVDMDVSEAVAKAHGDDPLAEDQLVVVKGPPGTVRREHVVTPHPTEHRLFNAKVFYLTSSRTGSAAEHLALAFKRTHRATLVGEHTAGANHFGGVEPLGYGLAAFIPVGRTLDPDTGQDWEGVGVSPDVAVPADQALDTALRLAEQ